METLDTLQIQSEVGDLLEKKDYKAALPKLERLISYLEQIDVLQYSDYWSNLLLMGEIQEFEKDLPAAVKTFAKVVAYFDDRCEGGSRLMPNALGVYIQGMVRLGLGQIELGAGHDAEKTFIKASDYCAKILGKESPEVATIAEYIEKARAIQK